MNLIICQSADNDQNNDYNLYLLAPLNLQFASTIVDREIRKIKEENPDDWDCSMIVDEVKKYGIVPVSGQTYTAEQV